MSCLTYRSLFICSLVSICGLFTDSQRASAQIVPDQTTATEVNGNAIAPVGAGTVSGGNLYHSFDQLNVPQSGITFSTGNSTVDGGKINNILNRVSGDNPSQILGTIESRTAFPNANLYLMNPNGVVFGKDARLDIGGSFNVSTGTSIGFTGDRQFSVDKAKLDFPSGNPQNIKFGIVQPAAIINQGNLTVDAGKSITFTAGSVVSSGILTAPNGNVSLTSVAAGSVVDLRSPDLVLGLSVAKNAVPTNWNGEITTLPRLAELLTGKAEQGDRVVVKPDGTLAIVATPTNDQLPITNGTTVVSGVINTSSVNSDGGKVGVFGDRVALINSQISSTGINGGKVLIGGDLQGNGTVPNAEFTYFDKKSVVDVSALTKGNGGTAIVWGNITTQFLGTILSTGGTVSGDGGFVEVSGKENLLYRGNVDTSAINGNFGTLLLDPTNITIVAADPSDNNQLSPNVPNTGDPAFAIFFNDVSTSNFTISNTLLNSATSNIILQARNDINVNAPVNVINSNISFTAQAGNNINFSPSTFINTNRGDINLFADSDLSGVGSINLVNFPLITRGGNFRATGVNFNGNGSFGGLIIATASLNSGSGGSITIEATGNINLINSALGSGISNTGTGNAGAISLKAGGDIVASALQAGNGTSSNIINGGNVTLDAGGNITIGSLGSISTRSTLGGKAGDILLKSGGSITALGTTGINASVIGTSASGQAGNVTFEAGTTINTDAAIASSINSNTVIGNAGNISLTAGGSITATGDLFAANLGTGNAGKIDVISTIGNITTGNIVAGSLVTASDVTLTALNNITTGYILGIGGTQGSNVSLTATNGNITIPSTAVIPSTLLGANLAPCGGSAICTTSLGGISGDISFNAGGTINILGQLLTVSLGNGKSGNISFTSDGNITTGFLITGGFLTAGSGATGDVSLTSTNGNITTTDIIAGISAVNSTGNAGNITISAFGDVNLISADNSITETTATGNAGKISITSQNGLIAASGNISSGVLRGTGNGNDLVLTANGSVSAVNVGAGTVFGTGKGGDIQITGNSINLTTVGSAALLGTSGNVTLNAVNDITAGFILNLGNTKGGDVTITSTAGTIQIPNTIPSTVPEAPGINLDPCVGSNICTSAKNGTAGNITIAGNLSLTNPTKFLSTGTTTGGAIALQDANINGTQNLTLDSGNGAINLGNIGATTNLGTLTINAGSILANQAIAANSISFTTIGNLTVNQIQTNSTINSGDLILNSGGALFINGNLDTSSTTGTSGLISLTAAQDIFANGAITFDSRVLGGNDSKAITVISQNGNITGSGLLDVITTARNAGAVTFQAANSILFRDIKTDGNNGTGGNVTIAATNGNITGNTILATSQGISTGSGNVSLTAGGDIAIASINTNTQNGKAGDISVKADLTRGINGLTDIQANSVTGQGGNITLESGSTLPNAGLNIVAGGAISGSTIDLRTASLLIGGDLIIDSPNSDILLGETSVQPSNFEIRNARNVTLSQRLLAERVDITNTGILKLTDANTLIETPIFQQQNAGEVQLTGEIRGTTITFNSPVVLTGNAILTAADSGITQGTIAFSSTLNGGGRDLKLSTNEIDFGNNVSGINALTLAPSSATVNIQLGGTTNVAGTFTLTETDLINVQAGGLGSLIIGGDFGAQISIVSPIPTFLQKTIIQADGFGNIDSTGLISQGSIIASAPIVTNGSNTITFIASQNVNIGDVTNPSKDIIVTSTNANVTTGKLNTTDFSVSPSGNVTISANNGSVSVNSVITRSSGSNAGNVSIQARNSIQTTGNTTIGGQDYAIATFTGAGNGGNVSLTSNTGGINVSSGRISTTTSNGTSGSVNFQAFGDIITGVGTTPNPAVATFINTGGTGTPNSITFTSNNGAINTSAGDIDAGGGAITFTARNNVTTSGIFSRALDGGSIKLESQSGAIDTTTGDLTTTTTSNGTGGTINLIAAGNITTRGVFANGNNGNITLQSSLGSIDTSLNDLASTGDSSNITLTALQNIVTRSIFAQGDGSNITIITSPVGNGNVSTGLIQTGIDASQTGDGGLLTIQAVGDISTGTINTPNLSSSFSGNAGSVLLTSSNGKVQFAGISARRSGGGGNGGNITVQSQGDIISTGVLSFGNVTISNASVFSNTQPINISLTSNTGKIDLSSGAIGGLDSSFQSFIPNGTITLRSASDIILGDVNGATAFGAGSISLTTTGSGAKITTGNISLNTQSIDPGRVTLITSGDITTKNINTSSLFANGNSISLTSRTGAVTTGNLTTSGSNNGANVVVIAETAITTGAIAAQGSTGRGGNVILDPVGNVTFTSINSTGNITLGGGGNINIVSTGGNVSGRGVVTFATGNPCAGATICTNGTGTVSIQHGISSVFDPNAFRVNSPDPINGTVGAIVTGSGSLLSFTGIPNGAGFFTQGNISITPGQGVFVPPVVPPVTPPVVPPSTPPSDPDSNQTITPINPIIVASISPIVISSTDFPFLDISKISNVKAGEYLALGNFEAAFNEIEKGHLSAYENYLGETLTPQIKNIEQLQQELDEVSQLSGSATTVVYPIILDDRLELMIIPPKGMGRPFREFVTEAKEDEIVPVILDFANNIRDASSQDYLEQSQQLYNWLVRPYQDRLQTLQDQFQPKTQVNSEQVAEKLPPTLVFVMDGGLRVIPVAALHDGKQFLVEKYALANLPYLRVSRLENRDRNLNSILAMGLTEEMQGFSALPSVKIEVSTISSQALKSSSYFDQEFTVNNLQDKRRQGNFAVLHLATHAQFTSNNAKGAFIQFWNERLPIDRIPSLRFDSPLVEMLTLSACQTAVGQNLGLGGLAISSGAKSVLASLWEVSDSGTAPLMIQFYNSFPENITKAIALQRAQIDMLSGKVRIENGNILGIPKLPTVPLSTLNINEINLSHPFFWSSFILIGNWL
ncbi:MAG: hypothetical protein DCE90_10485 [Pseudanabaena sp.]|nr:MAG: hypothetical protein DCE90_10485 [Pseudanabaena sp.]